MSANTAAMRRRDSSRAVPEDLRRHNRGLILDLLGRHGEVLRGSIASQTGLTGAAVSRISRELLDAGLVTEAVSGESAAGRGRPALALKLAANGGYVVGIGIGAYEQWVQVADLRGACIARRAVQMLDGRSPAREIAALGREVRSALRDAKVLPRRVFGVGVAVAGVVDTARARVVHSPNIGWRDVELGARLGGALRLPVVVDAMHHALNLAEFRHGASLGTADAVLVNISMGIGASVMVDGRIVRGSSGAAGQIGHMHVAGAKELCTCGRRGCLDTIASGHAVLRQLGIARERRVPREHDAGDARRLLAVVDRERAGERAVCAAFRACGERLGDALGAMRAALDPARLLLAGPLSQAGSYVEGVRARLGAGGGDLETPLVYIASHSADAAGASLALSHLVFSPALELPALDLRRPHKNNQFRTAGN